MNVGAHLDILDPLQHAMQGLGPTAMSTAHLPQREGIQGVLKIFTFDRLYFLHFSPWIVL